MQQQKSIKEEILSPSRRQQQQNRSDKNDSDEEMENVRSNETETDTDPEEIRCLEAKRAKEKTEKLLVEVCKQQQIITQTSQALNLCAATVEFSGSTESVEGERHLLVASEYNNNTNLSTNQITDSKNYSIF